MRAIRVSCVKETSLLCETLCNLRLPVCQTLYRLHPHVRLHITHVGLIDLCETKNKDQSKRCFISQESITSPESNKKVFLI